MGELFDREPERWGLRGDSHLWRALRDAFADEEVPGSDREVERVLERRMLDLTGIDLRRDRRESVYLERFAHGGISSGQVHLATWREAPSRGVGRRFPCA